LAGRVLLAAFVMSGIQVHLLGRAGVTEYVRATGAPAPELMVPLSGVAIVAGGLSVALGIWADFGAPVLAAFAMSVMFFMHAFWKEQISRRCRTIRPTSSRTSRWQTARS
jgi:uncharacterized membrane protein YphA (DoxX/SURF4 family)